MCSLFLVGCLADLLQKYDNITFLLLRGENEDILLFVFSIRLLVLIFFAYCSHSFFFLLFVFIIFKILFWNLKGKFCVFQAEKSEVMKAGHNFSGCLLYK